MHENGFVFHVTNARRIFKFLLLRVQGYGTLRDNNRRFRPIRETSSNELKAKERSDLQRLLRTQIQVLNSDLFVLTKEFGGGKLVGEGLVRLVYGV